MKRKLTIKEFRLLKGMTQKEFAEWIGMKHSTYMTRESGKREWKASELKHIADKLNVSIENDIDY